MASIKVIIIDITGGKKTPVELPDNAPMKRLIPALVTRMSLPINNSAGQTITYILDHERSGKRLREDDTLASIGIQVEDRLKLVPIITAGDGIRLRRLRADYEKLKEMVSGSEIISITKVDGDPPEKYKIRFTCKSVVGLNSGNPIYGDVHEVGIYLDSEYPRARPKIQWLTPIFHPNISGGTVCIGDSADNYGWWPGRPLDDLIYYLGQMAQYKMYNPKSPLNRSAADWSVNNKHLLPTDGRELRGQPMVINIGDAIVIGSNETPGDDLLDSIKIGP